jgi:polar amino acid transport system permease protein
MTIIANSHSSKSVDKDSLTFLRAHYPLRRISTLVVGIVLIALLLSVAQNPNFQWDVVAEHLLTTNILLGAWRTIQITVVAMLLGIVGGVTVALMRLSKNPLLSNLARVYTWAFRGLPVLVQLIFWFNLSALYPEIGFSFGNIEWHLDVNESITPFTAAVLGLGLCEVAIMAEIIRAGIQGVDSGQREAAEALGVKPWFVTTRVILPQAMRTIVPPTGNEIIMMVKTTALVSVLAMPELLYSAQMVYARTYETIPLLMVVCVWYLLITSVLTVGQSALEKYYSRGVRR